ncbi:MAG: hypothetical protein NTZ07_04125, partial [Candidatus Woesebacteria bacterium]|nr:hypothetical protein [Candidatus Woesebacteria bacterium]
PLIRFEAKLHGFRIPGLPLSGEYVSQRDRAIEMANNLGVGYLEVDQDLIKKVMVARWLGGATGKMFSNVLITPKKNK